MSKTISDALDLVPLETENPVVPFVQPQIQKVQQDEYEAAKENMENVVSIGTTALTELAQMANASQDPRVYRVLTELISAMTTANKEIIEMKKSNHEINLTKEHKSEKVQNNLFVGSTAELVKMLEDLKKKC